MESQPPPEEQGPLEAVRERAESWWKSKSREEQIKAVWRLWLIVLGLVVIIGGLGMLKRHRDQKTNQIGREWVEQTRDAASMNRDARGAIPSSAPGAPPTGVPQPGGAQPGMAQPGPGYGGAQPAQPTQGGGGRAYIPPTR